MFVGVGKLVLRLPENQSLKGKRRIIHSLTARVRNRFNVSIAEAEDNPLWQVSTLGIACLSNSSRHAQEVLDRVISYIQGIEVGEMEIQDWKTEVLAGF